MWSIYNGSDLIYDPRLQDYKLTAAELSQELNKADKLQFTIYPQHPSISTLKRLKSTIEAENDGTTKFRGRMLDDTIGWHNQKNVICEGALAWLNDSVQRPFQFPLDADHATPADYFAFLINRHNAQEPADRQFVVGTVTVTDQNNYIDRSDTEYSSTMKLIKEGLLDKLGGYLWPRYEEGVTYLDYLADFSVLANQPVQFGLNMLSLETKKSGGEICTAILPLGATNEETDEPLTISCLEDYTTDDICKEGDIIYSKTAEEQYGARIIKVVTWDDVTIAANLLTKAAAQLAQDRQLPATVTLTAADLSAAGYDYNTFSLGTYVNIVDDVHAPHELLARYLVTKLGRDLLNPAQNKLTLGATTYSLTESTASQIEQTAKAVEANVTKETTRAIREVEQRNSSAIAQSEEAIILRVSEDYYTKGETDELIGSVSTQIEQTAEGINITFSEMQQNIDDVQANADARFSALQSYIQLAGGTITLGEIGNEVTLKIENDRIGIYVNGNPVTYWTKDDFVSPFTLRIPVGGRLILGDFAFIPRSSGSLDFTWIG